VIGRRGGKSRAIAVLATYLAALVDYRAVLTRGETGMVMIIAPDTDQAAIIFDYAAPKGDIST
jgi:phage terminase large subunit-like protein